MAPIRVLSSSDDGVFRAALCGSLQGDDEVLLFDEKSSPIDELLLRIGTLMPDVVLLDRQDAVAHSAIERVHACFISLRIVMVVTQCGQSELADMIRHGARGCIQKAASPALWRRAVHAVHEGDIWVNRNVVLELLETLLGFADVQLTHQASVNLPDGRLTEREWEVARLVSSGMTNKEVARYMTISDTTVKTHLKHIFNKLKVTRRSQLPALNGVRHQAIASALRTSVDS